MSKLFLNGDILLGGILDLLAGLFDVFADAMALHALSANSAARMSDTNPIRDLT